MAPAPAEGKRNVYVGGVFGPGVAALDVAPGGALSQVPGSPFGPDAESATNGVALTPDGARLYATSSGYQRIFAFDVNPDGSLAEIPGVVIEDPAGADPDGIAISPDGGHAYVADSAPEAIRVFAISPGGALTPVQAAPLSGADNASGVAIAPGGRYLYATSSNPPSRVYGFAIAPDGSLAPLAVPFVAAAGGVKAVSISPDGRQLFAGSASSGVYAFALAPDGSLTPVPGSPFATSVAHKGVAASPLGGRLFVTDDGVPGAVRSFAIAADGSLSGGSPVPAGSETAGIAVTPDGSRVYAAGDLPSIGLDSGVSGFGVGPGGALAPIAGSPFPTDVELPTFPGLAVSPNQPPRASFGAAGTGPATEVRFDARGSTDTDGTIVRFDWDFGDGTALANGGPTPSHVYPRSGTYPATLTVTDSEGCSTAFVFTGQTASCNGSPVAVARRQLQ